jgi:glutamine amidotransferase
VLGICVGAQMLARSSEEGVLPGLGWVKAVVRAFKSWAPAKDSPLPHMGWNDVRAVGQQPMFNALDDARFYFLHSYFLDVDNREDILAVCDYGAEFCCAVRSDNVYGVQFHPEKSHHFGTQLLKNFSELPPC